MIPRFFVQSILATGDGVTLCWRRSLLLISHPGVTRFPSHHPSFRFHPRHFPRGFHLRASRKAFAKISLGSLTFLALLPPSLDFVSNLSPLSLRTLPISTLFRRVSGLLPSLRRESRVSGTRAGFPPAPSIFVFLHELLFRA